VLNALTNVRFFWCGGFGAPAPTLNMRFSPKKIYALAPVWFGNESI
jgi:hypothetical protein